jgi:hypothetical protein
MTLGPLALAIEFGKMLESFDLAYALGGSVASSLLGEPRTTIDVDFAVRLDHVGLERIIEATSAEFYVPVESARASIDALSSFNLISNASGLKIDLFVVGTELLDRRQLERRCLMLVRREPRAELWVTSAEDQILRKISWYRDGGEVSDRQWRDIVGLLRTQRSTLDFEDLRTAATLLGLDDLLSRAEYDLDRSH